MTRMKSRVEALEKGVELLEKHVEGLHDDFLQGLRVGVDEVQALL